MLMGLVVELVLALLLSLLSAAGTTASLLLLASSRCSSLTCGAGSFGLSEATATGGFDSVTAGTSTSSCLIALSVTSAILIVVVFVVAVTIAAYEFLNEIMNE